MGGGNRVSFFIFTLFNFMFDFDHLQASLPSYSITAAVGRRGVQGPEPMVEWKGGAEGGRDGDRVVYWPSSE